MLKNGILKNVVIFTEYSHLGDCREFTWIAGDVIGAQRMPSKFVIRGLRCDYDVEALMIRKDLYLRTETGQEYIVSNFQITDVSDVENVTGIAENIALLFEKFPDMKTITDGEKVAITKQTQLMAYKAVSNVVNSICAGQSIEAAPAKEVAAHLVEEIIQAPEAIINLVDIKSFDDYTFTHNINVATIAILIGHSMNLSKEELHDLGTGALLHDVGKLKISLSILNKEGKLTESEFKEMKRHPLYGYEILCKSDIAERSRQVALLHHEKFAGGGYPKGIKGEDILLFARITSIADVYDALTTDRPYRVAMPPYDAIRIVMGGVDTQFDPKILQYFIRRFSLYPNGSLVKLNDGSIAMVLRANEETVMRPIVKLLRDKAGNRIKERFEIDLMKEKHLFIAGPATLAMLNVTEGNQSKP